jgi:tetratricopeptide (TPR) repeat protein
MKRDRRMTIALGVVIGCALLSGLIWILPDRARVVAPLATDAVVSSAGGYPGEVHERFQQAAIMLHAGQAEHALTALERVLALAPDLPEAHVNAGFALYELSNLTQARRQFERAIDLRPQQVNAYYGLALTLEAQGDLDAALGAMRTYAHLAEERDPHVRKARSAIWEWQSERDDQAGEPRSISRQADTRETAFGGGG